MKYINDYLTLQFLLCTKHGSGRIKMSFTLPIMHEICMVMLRHNMNNKHKIEFTKSRVLWSHTVCLEELRLRVFDVNQCMKDRSNWPGVTLTFALFNHVFHVRCIKKRSLVVYNFFRIILWAPGKSVWNNLLFNVVSVMAQRRCCLLGEIQ